MEQEERLLFIRSRSHHDLFWYGGGYQRGGSFAIDGGSVHKIQGYGSSHTIQV
ncbi:uncharacterized protein MELLADRAFT_89481 [Melampsora larici-populina 98AG31]|uniref:Uncharacterized protein n=1 Tax=Melampsora larici-populina (strain 98AG31 / pathotype 3-4-7) TaxID=747676 RepID=F4RTI8_MELLP|nr:uncharacterized protein MELLADRAFT_89481 [Melampsora larici-populina 98AG31]EGG04329.1 hypothetical protein MELLADRAFT_89481 [Melampsora larici-populina 98AG31]